MLEQGGFGPLVLFSFFTPPGNGLNNLPFLSFLNGTLRMKIIFTVFNSQGELIDSPELQLFDEVTREQLVTALPSFRLGDAGHGITVRAKDFLKSTPDAAILEMLTDALNEAALLSDVQLEEVTDPHALLLAELNDTVVGEGDAQLKFVAVGDSQAAVFQLRDAADGLIFSLPLERGQIARATNVYNAIARINAAAEKWEMLQAAPAQDAKGQNPGVRMLTAADIQTMFSLTFPGFQIPQLDQVVEHPAPKIAEILAAYGEADSASNALTRETQLGDPQGTPAPVALSPAAIKPEDFNYDRDREEVARAYDVRFRGIIIDPKRDPFEGTYLPKDVVHMEGALHYLNGKLEWVKFPLAGNGGSWRIWLASVAGKRAVGGPNAPEVEIPPAGKPLSIRSELAKLAQTAPLAEKSNTTAVASASDAFYFNVKGTSALRVVLRGTNRVAAVEQGLVTFIQRELKSPSFHAMSNTFNVAGEVVGESVTVAVRTALQMLGLNDVTIDVEPTFLPLNGDYVGLAE
ncbi:hypothetical protein CF95_gp223 [Erwinia phage PhiEaH1]|uniref:Uncharacterized protein n=1 Tax=Erwinia phage PhiEaH1 TaxID=1401669 RepID=W8D015_9CAUD|nr:hypothetical protein CF95_gp223 [Erwinia phage PhiEaH1]AGX01945.1 hypothetical protein [Erwinia phage PhiEaH1]